MNRRSFLLKLGAAAASAAVATTIDPERLLWVPGAKTIVDLGAVKPIVPATDAEVLAVSDAMAEAITARNTKLFAPESLGPSFQNAVREANRDLAELRGEHRDIRLDIANERGELTAFKFKGDTLVSLHSAEELQLLERPFFEPEIRQRRNADAIRRRHAAEDAAALRRRG